ncbi:MAG: DUF362 domain-containing protein [Nitrospirae bacterium]|nr:DUF362 domain-containing protein [Nitrospirota bacterium]
MKGNRARKPGAAPCGSRREFCRNLAAVSFSTAFQWPGNPFEDEPPGPPKPEAEKPAEPRVKLPARVAVRPALLKGGDTAPKLRRAVESAVEASRAFERLKRGSRVLLKPAVNSDQPFPATTSPEFLTLVIHLLRDWGVRDVIVADRSGVWRDTLKCLQATGLFDAASKAGAKVAGLEFLPWDEIQLPGRTHWARAFRVTRLLSEVDHTVSLPTLRTHFLAGFTMAIKNNVGLVHMTDRLHLHLPGGLGERLAEIGMAVCPDAILLDARRAFIDGGPDKGDEVAAGAVIAGTNSGAVDAVGVALLGELGAGGRLGNTPIWDLAQIRRTGELGLGPRTSREIELDVRGLPEEWNLRARLG